MELGAQHGRHFQHEEASGDAPPMQVIMPRTAAMTGSTAQVSAFSAPATEKRQRPAASKSGTGVFSRAIGREAKKPSRDGDGEIAPFVDGCRRHGADQQVASDGAGARPAWCR